MSLLAFGAERFGFTVCNGVEKEGGEIVASCLRVVVVVT
jgi:hypothetical protein